MHVRKGVLDDFGNGVEEEPKNGQTCLERMARSLVCTEQKLRAAPPTLLFRVQSDAVTLGPKVFDIDCMVSGMCAEGKCLRKSKKYEQCLQHVLPLISMLGVLARVYVMELMMHSQILVRRVDCDE